MFLLLTAVNKRPVVVYSFSGILGPLELTVPQPWPSWPMASPPLQVMKFKYKVKGATYIFRYFSDQKAIFIVNFEWIYNIWKLFWQLVSLCMPSAMCCHLANKICTILLCSTLITHNNASRKFSNHPCQSVCLSQGRIRGQNVRGQGQTTSRPRPRPRPDILEAKARQSRGQVQATSRPRPGLLEVKSRPKQSYSFTSEK